uniref:Uncharacterized protein n=1 Tax=Rhizophora mucronata TaxID=61149 RepID=A0A2P2R4Q6_RHIMU
MINIDMGYLSISLRIHLVHCCQICQNI